jgi:hypothetical protein
MSSWSAADGFNSGGSWQKGFTAEIAEHAERTTSPEGSGAVTILFLILLCKGLAQGERLTNPNTAPIKERLEVSERLKQP